MKYEPLKPLHRRCEKRRDDGSDFCIRAVEYRTEFISRHHADFNVEAIHKLLHRNCPRDPVERDLNCILVCLRHSIWSHHPAYFWSLFFSQCMYRGMHRQLQIFIRCLWQGPRHCHETQVILSLLVTLWCRQTEL